jgi:hypothetical protein
MLSLTITDRFAEELRQWAEDQRTTWPEGTAYDADLMHLLFQLSPKGQAHQAQQRCADCLGLFNRLAAEREADKAAITALKAMIRVNFLRHGLMSSHEEIDAAIAAALNPRATPTGG